MSKTLPAYPRILAVAPNTSGFGFALMEGLNTLADWGSPEVRGDKNAGCIAKVEKMVAAYEPQVLVLEDSADSEIHRSPRIKELTKQLIGLGCNANIHVAVMRRKHVRQIFFSDGTGTKHAMAVILARWYPEELAHRLPAERKAWTKEAGRMAIFDAVALALGFRSRKMTRRDLQVMSRQTHLS